MLSTAVPGTPTSQPEFSTTLHGRRLWLARAIWLILSSSIVWVFATGLRLTFAQSVAFFPEVQTSLDQVGVPAALPASARVAVDVLTMLGFLCIAVFLFWRRSDDWMALFVSAMLMLTGLLYTSPYRSEPRVLLGVLFTLAEVSQIACLLLFPSGRWVPRWSWIVLVPFAVWRAAIWFLVYLPNAGVTATPSLYVSYVPESSLDTSLLVAALGGGILAQLYRYRSTSTLVQRQQSKWLLWSTLSAVLIAGGYIIVLNSLGTLQQPEQVVLLWRVVGRTMRQVALLLIPLSLMYAILRYRLWDIDLIINRALVYGILTAVLACVYAASVVLLQRLFTPLIGRDFDGAVVLSTLAIAALFSPLRRHIQTAIDRRFYRRKYDAATTLAAFSARLRDDADLETLTADLLHVVQGTMQPAHLSLWLCDVEKQK